MSKQHRDFVTYVRNGVEINALVAFSREVFTPATQTEAASSVEHLTVVYLDPNVGGGVPTGEALRNSIKIQMDVPPLTEGLTNGWKEAGAEDAPQTAIEQGPEVTSDEIASHLFEQIKNGESLTVPDGANLGLVLKVLSDIAHALKTTNNNLEGELATALKDSRSVSDDATDKLSQANAEIEQQAEKLANADRLAVEQDKTIAQLKQTIEYQKAKEAIPVEHAAGEQEPIAATQQGPGELAAENQAATAPATE